MRLLTEAYNSRRPTGFFVGKLSPTMYAVGIQYIYTSLIEPSKVPGRSRLKEFQKIVLLAAGAEDDLFTIDVREVMVV